MLGLEDGRTARPAARCCVPVDAVPGPVPSSGGHPGEAAALQLILRPSVSMFHVKHRVEGRDLLDRHHPNVKDGAVTSEFDDGNDEAVPPLAERPPPPPPPSPSTAPTVAPPVAVDRGVERGLRARPPSPGAAPSATCRLRSASRRSDADRWTAPAGRRRRQPVDGPSGRPDERPGRRTASGRLGRPRSSRDPARRPGPRRAGRSRGDRAGHRGGSRRLARPGPSPGHRGGQPEGRRRARPPPRSTSGACLADLGYRTLVVDLDPQGNASTGLGINPRALDASMYDVLLNDVPLEDCIEGSAVREPVRGPGQPRPGRRRDRAGPGLQPGAQAAQRHRRGARRLRLRPHRLPAVARAAHRQRHGRGHRGAGARSSASTTPWRVSASCSATSTWCRRT